MHKENRELADGHEGESAARLSIIKPGEIGPELRSGLLSFDKKVEMEISDHPFWYEHLEEDAWDTMINQSATLVLEDADDTILAYAAVKLVPEPGVLVASGFGTIGRQAICEIASIAAYPPKQGYGKQLLGSIEQFAHRCEFDYIMMHASHNNDPANISYAKAGYLPYEVVSTYIRGTSYYRGYDYDGYKIMHVKYIGGDKRLQRWQSMYRASNMLRDLSRDIQGIKPSAYPEWTKGVDDCIESFQKNNGIPHDHALSTNEKIQAVAQLRLCGWYDAIEPLRRVSPLVIAGIYSDSVFPASRHDFIHNRIEDSELARRQSKMAQYILSKLNILSLKEANAVDFESYFLANDEYDALRARISADSQGIPVPNLTPNFGPRPPQGLARVIISVLQTGFGDDKA